MFGTALAQVITSLPAIPGAPSPKSPAAFVAYIFIFALAIVGIAVLIAFVAGAFRYFASAGNPSAVSDAKSRMSHALLGLAVVVFSVITLYTINPGLLRLKNPGVNVDLSIPKTGGAPPSCKLMLAQWAGNGLPGNTVGMVTVGANCPDGTSVVFAVLNTGGTVQTNISAVFQAGQAGATWTVPAGSDGQNFYFDAVLGSDALRSQALQIGGGGAPPLGQDCANTAPPSGQAPATCDAPCASTVNPNVVNPATGLPYADTCDKYIGISAVAHQIPSAFIVAIMQQECPSGNPYCTNSTGGCGLMGIRTALLFDASSPYASCLALLGAGAADATQACVTMQANPNIAIDVGACMLQVATQTSAAYKSLYNYPPASIQYIAAAWQAGNIANKPSCNCRNSGDALPAGCGPQNAMVCQSCFTNVPRWVCPLNAPAGGTCGADTLFASTRTYAATTDMLYAHYASCAQWQ